MKEYTACVLPGSYDPVTLGHLDMITLAARMFDRVYVTAFRNTEKHGMFTEEEKLTMLRLATEHLENVVCSVEDGVLADFAAEHHAVIVKGVRGVTDFDYEFNMAAINRSIRPEAETVLLPARQEHTHVSSTYVRDMIIYHRDLTGAVPAPVIRYLEKQWRK